VVVAFGIDPHPIGAVRFRPAPYLQQQRSPDALALVFGNHAQGLDLRQPSPGAGGDA
jgi:hypothetical protein